MDDPNWCEDFLPARRAKGDPYIDVRFWGNQPVRSPGYTFRVVDDKEKAAIVSAIRTAGSVPMFAAYFGQVFFRIPDEIAPRVRAAIEAVRAERDEQAEIARANAWRYRDNP